MSGAVLDQRARAVFAERNERKDSAVVWTIATSATGLVRGMPSGAAGRGASSARPALYVAVKSVGCTVSLRGWA